MFVAVDGEGGGGAEEDEGGGRWLFISSLSNEKRLREGGEGEEDAEEGRRSCSVL